MTMDGNDFLKDLMDEVMDYAKRKIEHTYPDNEECVRMLAVFHCNLAANLLYKVCDEYMLLMNVIKEMAGNSRIDPNVN